MLPARPPTAQRHQTSSQAEKLKAEIQTGRFRCARQVREWLQATFGVAYSLSGTKRLLQRRGCSYHKTTGFLFKAKRDKQEEFVQKYEADRPAEGAAMRRYFVDACHPIWGLELVYSRAGLLPPGFERAAKGYRCLAGKTRITSVYNDGAQRRSQRYERLRPDTYSW